MKKRFLVLAAVLVFVTVPHRQTEYRAVCAPIYPSTYTFMPAQGVVRGRVYLFGSLNVLSGSNFSDELRVHGIQVISLAVPVLRPCLYQTAYARSMNSALETITTDVDARHGKLKSLIGGGSIGGLHAMIGFVQFPRFAGWFASVPVTRLASLSEFSGLTYEPSFDPFLLKDQLRASHGFITWGTKDTRTDWHFTRKLYEAIKSPTVDHIEYIGLPHTTTRQQIDDLEHWISSQF